jgi:PAS domain S-box-containing protein
VENAITGTVGVAVDVTDRMQTEEELRDIETRYQTLAEVCPVGIFRTDAQGNTVYANGLALRMIGQTLAEVVRQGWYPPVAPEDVPRHKAAWSASIVTGVPLYSEHRFLRPDGSTVWVVCQAVAERQPDGKILGFVGTLTDISQLKRAEDLLRQSEHRNRLLVETGRDVIFTLAPDHSITSLSPAFKTITGFEVADWLGKSFGMLVHPEDASLSTGMIGRCLQGESSPIHEARIRKQSGDYAIGEFTLTLLLDGGRVTGVLGIGRDITDRKKLEDQFRQSQKMEAVGQLAGGVAHDFNNLLTVITGNAELLLDGTNLGSRQMQECLQDVKQAGLKAASLTRQLLAFSRKQLMTPEVLDLNNLITNLQKMLRRLIGEDINLSTNLAPDLWLVKADPGQIEQVLLNLAVNSRDAMPQGGKLSISTANTVLDEEFASVNSLFRSGDFVMLAVEDTGCGMDETTQSHIFEPFFTTKEIGKGTGLGLATVYGIVSQSNGHIDVSSHTGQGTTFRIYLPRHRIPTAPAVASTSQLDDGRTLPPELRGTETVLLVEDEEMVRNLARDILRQAGHTVLEARHGSEAIRICEQYGAPIHLIVTDVVMPEMGGIELMRRIKSLRPHVKFLYISGYTDDALIRQGIRTDEVSYLPKPFTRKDLITKVRGILNL